jgi:general secretion pathway protein G
MPASRYRCPFCREVTDWGTANTCPRCGRSALLPGFFRKRPRPASSRDGVRERPWDRQLGPRANLWGFLVARTPATRAMLAVGVFAVLGAMLCGPRMPPPAAGGDPAALSLAQDNLAVLQTALGAFRDDCGRFPVTAEGLAALVHNPEATGWQGPYIKALKPDPWGRPFRWVSDGRQASLLSAGADGVVGTGDDVSPPAEQPEAGGQAGEGIDVGIDAAPGGGRGQVSAPR